MLFCLSSLLSALYWNRCSEFMMEFRLHKTQMWNQIDSFSWDDEQDSHVHWISWILQQPLYVLMYADFYLLHQYLSAFCFSCCNIVQMQLIHFLFYIMNGCMLSGTIFYQDHNANQIIYSQRNSYWNVFMVWAANSSGKFASQVC